MSREKLDKTFQNLIDLESRYNETNEVVKQQKDLLDQARRDVQMLKETKFDTRSYLEAETGLFRQIRKLKLRAETCENRQTSIESWVEKYLPLKMHTMITQQLEDCIHPKKLEDFKSISKLMAETLRKNIFDDVGYSKLKNKTLDLITELRLENGILNDEKTAARAGLPNGGATNRNVKFVREDPKVQAERILALQEKVLAKKDPEYALTSSFKI